jgi:pimeloyl-ACP methyl ester carboxylesterase
MPHRAATLLALLIATPLSNFAADPPKPVRPTNEQRTEWTQRADAVIEQLREWKAAHDDHRPAADVEIGAKGVQWILRHNEFHKPNYIDGTKAAVELAKKRLAELTSGKSSWLARPGQSIVLGYYSALDGSVQPLAVTLPKAFDPQVKKRWPLHLVLHGRDAVLTETSFIQRFEGKTPKEDHPWIQLDVFGRTNNAYRWAGEVDVFEALSTVKRLYPIDEARVTLWGFSMGGAGAWHLGLHYPDQWSSVGAGAGFSDTVKYLNLKEPLSPLHTKLVRIYDASEYAMNAADVPTIGYGGELDKQLAASQLMNTRGKEVGVDIPVLIGPQTEHKFHPDSWKEFLAFHTAASEKGRPPFPGHRELRFITCTVKYNQCEWITVEEQIESYEPSVVEAKIDDNGVVRVMTKNVAVLQIARDVADAIVLDDGQPLPLTSAAGGLLPGVYFSKEADGWTTWDYRTSHDYLTKPALSKRKHVQGPIDDAFTRPFICVRGTGTPWSREHHDWAESNLQRFEQEYDKYLRAKLPVITDRQFNEELFETHNVILFGDPGSNSVLAKVVDQLPLVWNKSGIEVRGEKYDANTHGVPLIYPSPFNRNRYVVVNSGHTFHKAEFEGSNAQLYPRLGDIGVIQFRRGQDGQFNETVLWSEIFNTQWSFLSGK